MKSKLAVGLAVVAVLAIASAWILLFRVPSGSIGVLDAGRPGEPPRLLGPGIHMRPPGATTSLIETSAVNGSGKVMVSPASGGELELSYSVTASLSTAAAPDVLASLEGRPITEVVSSRAGTLLNDYASSLDAITMLASGFREQAATVVAEGLGRQGFEAVQVTVHPLDDDSLLAAARALASRGEAYRVRQAIAEALLRPEAATSWKLHTAMGMVNESEKQFAEAERYYFDALAIDPTAVPPMAQLVVLYGARKDWMRLSRALDAALTAAPRSLQHINWMAMVLLKQEDYAGAERILKAGLEVEPTNSTLLANLGALYTKRGRAQEAEQAFRQAVEAAPENPQALFNLGSFLASSDRFADALPLLQRAEATGSVSYPLVRSLAVVHEKLGHAAEAASYRRRAQEMEAMLKQRRGAAQEAGNGQTERATRAP